MAEHSGKIRGAGERDKLGPKGVINCDPNVIDGGLWVLLEFRVDTDGIW